MKKLLFIGDGPDVPSGFGRATREILARVSQHYDVTVLGINHRGDPSTVPYPVYTAAAGGDWLGVGRTIWMCELVRPDIIVIQNDGWFIPLYIDALRKLTHTYEYEHPEFAATPVVAAVAVDGKNFNGDWIKDVSTAVFWTQFAYDEARVGGYAGPAKIIPLGVDQQTFYPVSRELAMERQKIEALKYKFVVGNVNRNQPRKRWDLTLRYFANWVKSRGVDDAFLFLHSAPTGDKSINIHNLACYYGIADRVIIYTPEPFYGKPDDDMRDLYNCFDVLISTTQGEGMGLPAMEAMACAVPCILPEWSALGDWAKGAAAMVPCTSTALQTFSPTVNVLGGVADERQFIEALDLLYRDKDHRRMIAERGFARVSEERFRWDAIGAQWVELLNEVLVPPAPLVTGEVWQELKA
jgi:D-inositol-3-phosphate glycosyltransferase